MFAQLRNRRFAVILLLGFSSGLPLLLVGATLRYWLADKGIDLGIIGLFALVSLPYALKFLWAPLLDRLNPPLLKRLGRRRGWGLMIQTGLMIAVLALAQSITPQAMALLALLVAFLSASQDVVIDAIRVEMLDPSEYATGAAVVTLGYRLGMLAASAGALYMAQLSDWRLAYTIMAALVAIGMAGFLLAAEPDHTPLPHTTLAEWLRRAVVMPLLDLTRHARWPLIIAFVITYKLAPVLALGLTSPLYHDLGFTKGEVAGVTKVFGLIATIIGGFAGAWVVNRAGLLRALFGCGVAQALALFPFACLAMAGHTVPLLVLAVGAENFTGAMAAAAFVTYLSALCNREFTATQYALLLALTAIGGDSLGSLTGFLAKDIGWTAYYLAMPLLALPGLGLLLGLRNSIDLNNKRSYIK